MPSFAVFKGQKDSIPRESTTTKPDALTGDSVYVRITASGWFPAGDDVGAAAVGLAFAGLGVPCRHLPLSVASGNFEIPGSICVQGSLVAPRHLHRQMLDFAARHRIEPIVETFAMSEEGIKTAMDKLKQGDVHYCAVLTN
ncbi:hypothetical protein PG994_003192 [Apiospora phragmitis]|uniref:Alcohol dehydrogenase-like C-terminal domain-containing protein n=1 Tax=Apiospora phragmitis TaxID=2905665 RepID=A0ABR1W0G9_9PEZI